MKHRLPDRKGVLGASIIVLAMGLASAGVLHAESDDAEVWVIGAEEQALCSRALRECTPLLAEIADQRRESATQTNRMRAKLRRQKKAGAEAQAQLLLRIENLERELEAIKASTSWWITSPLRSLYALLFGS